MFYVILSLFIWMGVPNVGTGEALSSSGVGLARGDGEVEVTLENHCDGNVRVFHVPVEGEETLVFEMDALSYAHLSTYPGHSFAIRDSITNELVEQIVIGSEYVHSFGHNGCVTKASLHDGRNTGNYQHRHHPMIEYMHQPPINLLACKFKSLSTRSLQIWRVNQSNLDFVDNLETGGEKEVYTTEHSVYVVTEKDNNINILGRFVITSDRFLYLVRDAPELTVSPDVLELAMKEEAFQQEYLQRTGIQYRHYFGRHGPRPPPSLHMWPASEVGQVHKVNSSHGYWICEDFKQCRTTAPLSLELEVISTHPKIFIIENFLSDAEAESLISHARPRLFRSKVGPSHVEGKISDIRTSSTTWISRSTSDLIDTLHMRAADILGINQSLFDDGVKAESIQVVRYTLGQKYDPHYDWSVTGAPESRFITLLLYLNTLPDRLSGGETAFPKADGGHGIKVYPKKGTAVLFYSLLEDGNGDDLSLHQAMPVKKGEKWLANFWVWDP